MASKFDSSDSETCSDGEDAENEVLLEGLSSDVSKFKIECYLENKKKSKGGTVSSMQKTEEGWLVTFEDHEAAEGVVKKREHKIAGYSVKANWFTEERTENGNIVLLVGLTSDVSLVKIKSYLEHRKKSNGGDVSKIELTKRGFLVTFESQTDAEGVIKKGKHEIAGYSVNALWFKTLPRYKNRIFVDKIPDDVDKGCLEDYFEAKTECDIEKIQYGEEPSMAVITFEEDIDFEQLQQKVTRKPLSDNLLIEEVEMSNVIKVDDGLNMIPEIKLKLYFENKKKSGGGPVGHIKRDGNIFLVYFENYQDAEDVSTKKHVLQNREIDVDICFECLGVHGGSTDPSVCKIPDPIPVSQDLVGDLFLKLMETKPMIIDRLNKILYKYMACIEKTSDNKLSIRNMIDETAVGVPDRVKLRTWTTDVKAEVIDFIKTNIKEQRLPCKTNIKTKKVEHMLKTKLTDVPEIDGTIIHQMIADTILVYGTIDAVHTVVERIQDFVKSEELSESREKNSLKTVLHFKDYELIFLKQTGNLYLLKEKYPLVIFSIDGKLVNVNGLPEEIETFKSQIEHDVSDLTKFQSDLSDNQKHLICNYQNQNQLYQDIKKNMGAVQAVWLCDAENMIIYSKRRGDSESTMKQLKEIFPEKEIIIEEQKQLILQSKKFKALIEGLEKKFNNECLFSIPDGVFTLTAHREVMDRIFNEIHDMLHSFKILTEKVNFPNDSTKNYYQGTGMHDIQHIEEKFNVKLQLIDGALTLIGVEREDVQTASDFIQHIMSQHKEKTIYYKNVAAEKLLFSAHSNKTLELNGAIVTLEGLDLQQTKDFKIIFHYTVIGTNTTIYVGYGSPQFLHCDTVLIPVDSTLQPIGNGGKIGLSSGPGMDINQGNKHSDDVIIKKMEVGEFYAKSMVYGVYPGVQKQNVHNYIKVIIEDTLEHAENQGCISVALPCIASNSATHRNLSNKVSLETVEDYVRHKLTTIQKVWFYADSEAHAHSFEKLVQELNSQNTTTKKRYRKKAKRQSERLANSEKKQSAIRICLVTSDITMEEVDAVVNSTNNQLSLSGGAISSALLKRCGPKLQEQCKNGYPRGIKEGDIAITNAFNMASRKVYHCCLPMYTSDPSMEIMKQTILKCLHQAVKDGMKNIAFPAIGTGILQYPHDKVAALFFETVHMFGEENQGICLTDVIFIMYTNDANVIKAFEKNEKEFRNKYGSSIVYNNDDDDDGDTNDIIPLSIHSKPSAVLVNIYSTSEQKLKDVIAKCEHVLGNIKPREVRTREIADLDDDQVNELFDVIEKSDAGNDVEVLIDRNNGLYKAKGEQQDITAIKVLIDQYIRDQVKREQEAEILQQTVQWYYSQNNDAGEQIVKYDCLRNLKIDKAYLSDKKRVKVKDDDGEDYLIDFVRMVEQRIKHNEDYDQPVAILRKTPIQDSKLDPPVEWGDMSGKTLDVDTLKQGGAEYLRVSEVFTTTFGISDPQIDRIERVKNVVLYQQYTAMKMRMENEYKKDKIKVERQLFHGTNIDATKGINKNGFNRSYCGTKDNASLYGSGVYFAKESGYSVRDDYAKKDRDGMKYVYLADVLVGKYTNNQDKSQKYPPFIDEHNKTLRYDCVVDKMDEPRVFVIFNDTQAYPKYLIVFKG